MESSIESTIEKIKLQEHAIEAKLKEKRTHEATVISINRGIRDALTHSAKLKHEYQEAVTRTEAVGARLQIEKARQKALSDLLEDTQKELQNLLEESIKGIATVWNLRSQLCKTVQNVSDQCDVWALFTKPKNIKLPTPTTRKVVIEINKHVRGCYDRLRNALERHRKIQADRNRLQSEPDTGEEFLRIKNALRYSAAMTANINKRPSE